MVTVRLPTGEDRNIVRLARGSDMKASPASDVLYSDIVVKESQTHNQGHCTRPRLCEFEVKGKSAEEGGGRIGFLSLSRAGIHGSRAGKGLNQHTREPCC